MTLQEIKQKLNSQIAKDQQEINALESKLAHIRKAKRRTFREGETFLIVEASYKTTLEYKTPKGYYDGVNEQAEFDRELSNFRNIFHQLKEAKRVLQATKDMISMRGNKKTGVIAKYILGVDEMTQEATYISQELDAMYKAKSISKENNDLLLERQLQVRGLIKDFMPKHLKQRNLNRSQFMTWLRSRLSGNLYANDTLRNINWYGLNADQVVEIQINLATANFKKEIETLKGGQHA